MPDLSRSQLLVYGAVALTLLLVGARWLRSADQRGSPPGEVSLAGAGSADSAGANDGGDAGGAFSIREDGGDVVVHVAGAVREPGVYRLPSGSRVTDALKRAGGASVDASLDAINLAARLADGQQVVVPAAAGSDGAGSGAAASAIADGPISLGTATAEQLEQIEGIGPVTAQKIVEFRDQRGGLASVEELDQLSGIGPATMETLRGALQP